jgi:hypothetical protein
MQIRMTRSDHRRRWKASPSGRGPADLRPVEAVHFPFGAFDVRITLYIATRGQPNQVQRSEGDNSSVSMHIGRKYPKQPRTQVAVSNPLEVCLSPLALGINGLEGGRTKRGVASFANSSFCTGPRCSSSIDIGACVYSDMVRWILQSSMNWLMAARAARGGDCFRLESYSFVCRNHSHSCNDQSTSWGCVCRPRDACHLASSAAEAKRWSSFSTVRSRTAGI